MNVLRAHNYQDVEAVRNELDRLPRSLADLVPDLPFIILPDGLSPVWIGLMVNDMKVFDGRSYDKEVGGWYSDGKHPNWKFDRHVFIATRSIEWATIHEVAHAIDDILGEPSKSVFRPERALFKYMASNHAEYFACAMDAYLRDPRDDARWNRDDLASADPDMVTFIETLIGVDA